MNATTPDPLAELRDLLDTEPVDVQATKDLIARWRGSTERMVQIAWQSMTDPEAVDGLLERLRAVRGLGQVIQRLEAALREQTRKLERETKEAPDPDDPRAAPPLVSESLPAITKLDGADNLLTPSGWRITEAGIVRRGSRHGEAHDVLVAARPIVIASRSTDLETGQQWVEVAWLAQGTWVRRRCPRSAIKIATELTRLSDNGAPVSQATAMDLVRFLDRFEQVNEPFLRSVRVTQSLGWKGKDGQLGFLLGHQHIRPPAEAPIDFQADDGIGDIGRALHTRGTPEGWREVEAIARKYPKLMVAVYASLAPALLPILGAKGFNVDFAAVTSTGKTTALKVAASVWGSTDEHAAEGLIRTWDTTATAIQRLAATLHNLPVLLDDTKRASNPQLVAQTLYLIPQGQGKARGNRTGLDRVEHWHTVLMSTGEHPATTFRRDGGANARTLQFWGPPLGKTTTETATDARRLQHLVAEHYGHLGRAFVLHLVREPQARETAQALYRDAQARWERATAGSHIAGRAAATLAVLDVVKQLVERWCRLRPPDGDPLAEALGAIAEGSKEADVATQVLPDVLAWAAQHRSRFYARGATEPSAGWLGAWEEGDDWSEIAFIPADLRKHLTELGHEPDAVLRAWHERGNTIVELNRSTARKRIGGPQVACVVLKRSALEARSSRGERSDETE